MSVMHVMLPPLAQLAAVGHWPSWLARGDRLPERPEPRTALVRQLLPFPGTDLPTAALRHHLYAADAASGAWLCADPAWVRSEATGARLMAWPLTDVTADEAQALATSVQPLFGDAGMPLVVDTPNQWCVRLADGAQPPAFSAPAFALGTALLDCLPAGAGGRAWRRLFSEVQIVLHAHAVNAARIAAGQHPVNALWFWGAGALPHAVATGLRVVASRDDTWRGLAKIANIPCVEPLLAALKTVPSDGDALLDLADDAAHHDFSAWLTALQRDLRTGRYAAVELTFASGERFCVRHAHRLRFWRHA
ncbi:MAG TPA: phosphoglycerate mutase [Rhodanobacteraceae bacterium]